MELFLEIAILAVAPWPLYRLLSIPVFRNSFFCFAIRAAGILVVYAASVTVLAIYFPSLLRIAAVLALIAFLAERWRARPAFQVSKDVPPGSLALVPRGPWTDLNFFETAARKYGPIFKISHFFRPMVCIVGARRGIALLGQFEDSLTTTPVRFNKFIPRGFLRYMEQQDHEKYKRIFQRALSGSVLSRADGFIRVMVQSDLKRMAAESASTDHRSVRPQDLLYEMLLAIFVRLFFGVEQDTDAFRRLDEQFRRIDIKKASCASTTKEMKAANQISDIISGQVSLIKSLRADGREPPNCFLTELVQQDPPVEIDQTILLNLVYIVQAGRSDMMGLLTWILKLVCDNPDWMSRLHDELSGSLTSKDPKPDPLASRIVKEALRLEQSEFIFRRAKEDLKFDGFLIPKGWNVRICIREGHRDADIFEHPQRFDPDRFLLKTYGREEYSPLGILRHSCLGARIIETVGQIFVSELAQHYSCVTAQDGPREYGRAHWEPSSQFRISLSPANSTIQPETNL